MKISKSDYYPIRSPCRFSIIFDRCRRSNSPGNLPGAAAPTLVVLKSSPIVDTGRSEVVQLIGLVDYPSLNSPSGADAFSPDVLWTRQLMLHLHLPGTNCSNGWWPAVRRTKDGLRSDSGSLTISSCDLCGWQCSQTCGRIHSMEYQRNL